MQKRHIMPWGMIVIGLLAAAEQSCRRVDRGQAASHPEGANGAAGPSGSADAAAVAVHRSACKDLTPYKIVGGQSATDKTQVAAATLKLIIKGQKFCSATLIGPQHIVTAAHCMDGIKDPADIKIGSGVDGKFLEKLQIDMVKVHPLYTGVLADDQGYIDQPMYDVAALHFQGSLPPELKPVGIAQPGEIQAGMSVIVSGYGAYGSDDKTKRPLSLVETRLGKVDPVLMELQIASGDGRGACFGDSGGPTFIVDSATSCLLLIGSTTGPGRNTDYSCESGGGTLMDLTRYQSWLACTYKNLNQPLDSLSCDSK